MISSLKMIQGLNFHLKTTAYILMALNSQQPYTKSTSQIMKKSTGKKIHAGTSLTIRKQ
ncbi:MAG: hypothetical protein IPN54_03860 [Bacteroidetes bacterium]|nr:hypothetical protein [Bacteroidota bacterium]